MKGTVNMPILFPTASSVRATGCLMVRIGEAARKAQVEIIRRKASHRIVLFWSVDGGWGGGRMAEGPSQQEFK